MSRYYLMEKPGEGQMFVPPEKREMYELDGWKVVEFPSQSAPSTAEDVTEVRNDDPAPEAPRKKTPKSK